MPVSFKVVDNRTEVSKRIKELKQQVENYGKYFLEGMATEIVLNSPVDTGTYMESHTLSYTTPSSFTSSYGKPKKQDYNAFAQPALDRLITSIGNLGDSWTNARFSNSALHASDVEYKHGYAVYTMARNKAGMIAQDAVQRARDS